MENVVPETGVGCCPVVTGVSIAQVFAAVPSPGLQFCSVALTQLAHGPTWPVEHIHDSSLLTIYKRLSYVTISASAGAVFINYLPCEQCDPLWGRNCIVVAGSPRLRDETTVSSTQIGLGRAGAAWNLWFCSWKCPKAPSGGLLNT